MITMVLFTDPRQVTNWLDPLEKNYTEQRKQRELHHSQSKTVWEQEEAATFTAGDFDQVLKGLSSLSKTAKQISTDREERKYTDFVKGYEQLKFSDQEKIEQIASETDLSLNDANLLKTLSKSGKISPEALIYLEQQSGSKALRLKRLLGWQTVEKSIATLDSEIEQNLYGIRDNFNEAERTGKVDIFYRNALTDKLRKLGLNDRFIATHYEAEINKFSNTKGLSSKLDYKTVEFSKDAAERIATFEKLKYSTDPTTAATIFGTYLQKQIDIDPENGRSKAITFMHRLMKDGKINGSVIQAIKKGAYKSDVGETGKELISDSDWKYIEQGEQEYLTQVKTDHDTGYATLGAQYEAGLINKTVTPEQLENFLLKAKNNGQENTDWYKRISKHNPAAQNATVFQKGDKEFGKSKNRGTLHDRLEEIKNHPNDDIREKYKPLAEKVKTFITDNPDEFGDLDEFLKDFVYSTRTGNSLESNTISDDDGFVVGKLRTFTYQRLYHYLEQELKGAEPIDNLARVIKDERDAYWEANGGGLEAAKDKTAPGMFSRVRDTDGNLQWANIGVVSREKNNRFYDHTYGSPNKDQSYNNKVRKFGNIPKEERWERVDGIYNKDQILGLIKHGYFSEDMKYDAARDGLLPGEALDKAIEALVKNDKDFATRHNLKEWSFDGEKESPDVRINDALTNYLETADLNKAKVIKNIQSHIRWYGFDSLSMKNRQLIYNILENIDPSSQVRRDALADSARLEENQAKQRAKDEKEFYRTQANIKKNNQLRTEANQTPLGTQEYFRGTDDRTAEELDEQFNALELF